MTADTISQTPSSGAQWGLYKNGSPVIVSSSVLSFGFKAESDIPNYPVELGGFQSYNKVQLPNSGRLRYTRGGSLADRTSFLSQIEAAKQSTDVYDCVTPEATYLDMNVLDYNYDRRNNSGVGILIVDVIIQEVRQTGSVSYITTPNVAPVTKARNGASNDPVNDGTLQTEVITNKQNSALGLPSAPVNIPFQSQLGTF